jgi:hypothetical protein
MASRRTRSLALGCAGILAAGVGVTVWLASGPVSLNRAQARAMLPAVNAYLDKNAGKLGYGSLDTRLKPRMFCDASIIGITPDGLRWRVSMVMNCGEYARRGSTLLEGAGGYPGIGEVMILSGRREGYQGLSLKVGSPYYGKAWADQNLSSGAAAEVLSASPPTAPDPIRQAWRAFGFPAGTPAIQD